MILFYGYRSFAACVAILQPWPWCPACQVLMEAEEGRIRTDDASEGSMAQAAHKLLRVKSQPDKLANTAGHSNNLS